MTTIVTSLRRLLSGGNVWHMATKIQYDEFDTAAQTAVRQMIDGTGLSYRALESALHGRITYSRLRDICTGRRAPVRLSEFIRISIACGHRPSEALRRVLEMADMAMTDEQRAAVDGMTEDITPDYRAIPAMELAANRDESRDLEAETPDE